MLNVKLTALALSLGLVTLPSAPQEMPVPTAEHKSLQESVGHWKGTMKSFVGGMEMEVDAVETVESIGPFWTQVRFECDFMGMPYTGTGHMGYDPEKKKYVGTWVDSMSSTFALMEGEQKGDTLTMKWMAPDMTGNKVPHWSETTRTKDAYTAVFYQGEEGTKTMEMSMKRVAQAAEASAGK